MTRNLAVGIVGCGRMGRERVRQLRRLGIHVAFLVDDSTERAVLLAAEAPGTRVAATLADVTLTDVDALFLCTPPGVRRADVSSAARAGVALFVEKPVATTLADAEWMRDTTAAAGLLTSVGYMNRYRRGVERARELAAGSEVLGIHGHWIGKPYAVPWWRDESMSGGPINEQATHLVDVCRYVGGEVTEIAAQASRDRETLGVVLSFQTGAIATLLYSFGGSEKDIAFSVFTRVGALHLDGWDFRITREGVTIRDDGDEDPFALEVASFLGALESGDRSSIRSTIADACETQRVMDRVRSAIAASMLGVPAT